MKHWILLVVFVALYVSLTSLPVMSLGGDVSELKKTGENKHQAAPEHVQNPPDNKKEQPSQFETRLIEEFRTLIEQEKAVAEQQHADGESWNSPAMLAQWGLLIGSLIYAGIALFQLVAIKGQARIAKGTLNVMRDQDRPWITMAAVALDGESIGKNGGLMFRIQWFAKNVGKGPAFIKKIHMWGEVRDFPVVKPPLKDMGLFISVTGLAFEPGFEHTNEIGVMVQKEAIEHLSAQKKYVSFSGFIEYHRGEGTSYCTRFFLWWRDEGRGKSSFNIYDIEYE